MLRLFNLLVVYVLTTSAGTGVASRRLVEHHDGRHYGVLVRPARKLAAGPSHKQAKEEAALLSLSQELATADAAKLRWQPGTDHCKWLGVYCTDDQHVYFIDLSNQGISGTLSDAVDLSELQELQSLWLQGNQLAGTLPASLFSLPSLRELLLYENAIEGSLPAEALAATGLLRINLNGNKLGTLPDAVSALSNLEVLQLATNNLEGTVPAAFAGLTKLKTLALHNNLKLSGCIPAALQSKERPVRLETDESQPPAAGAAGDPALANTQVCGFCSSTCTDPETAAAEAAAAAAAAAAAPASPSSSPSELISSDASPSLSSSPDVSDTSISPSPAAAADAAAPESSSPAPLAAAQSDADPNALARKSLPVADAQAAAAGVADTATSAAAGDAAAAAATAAGGAPAFEQPAIFPLDGTNPAAAPIGSSTTAGSAAAGSSGQGSAVGAPIVIPVTSPSAAGSQKVEVHPDLTVLEDDVQGKTQVYMEFEGHPSYVAASGSRARRKRVLM